MRAESLRRCLAALARQSEPPSEVVVVSDASPDHSRQVALSAPIEVTFLELPERRGPAAARNAGIAATSDDVVAFTDDDCEPEPGWLEAISRAATRRGFAGAGGRVVAAEDHLAARYAVRHRVLEPPRGVPYVVTCNCAYRREALTEAGGFDARITRPGGEDPELSSRVRAAGHRLAYEPWAVVRHHFRRGIADLARTFFRYGRGGRPAEAEGTEPVHLRELAGELEKSLRSSEGEPAAERAAMLALRATHVVAYRAGWAWGGLTKR